MNTRLNRRTTAFILGIAALSCQQAAQAQQGWPTKPVRIVVPFAAGGPSDVIARLLASKMTADLGQPVVIDNKGGAGGALGTNEVIKSSDGHSILFGSTGSIVLLPAMAPNPNYNPVRDLAAVGQAVYTPSVAVVSAKSNFNTLNDVAIYARANPAKLNFASSGNGTSPHLGGELFKRDARVYMTHIPYRGIALAVTDLMGGSADVMFADVPAVVTYIRGGQIKALAIADPARSPALPDVPTSAEAGFKTVLSGSWYGLLVPAKTPPEVIQKINTALNRALLNPETVAFFRSQGIQGTPGTPQEFTKFIQAESVKWSALIKSAAIKPE